MTTKHTFLTRYGMEICLHRFVVRNTFGIGTFHDAFQLLGQEDLLLLHDLIIADNTQGHIRTHHGQLVQFFVREELARNFYDALMSHPHNN